MKKIIVGGDLAPTESNIEYFAKGDVEELIGRELLHVLKNADYRIFNLEMPLADQKKEMKKYGPHLIAPSKTIAGIKAVNPDLLAMANNHILDQGTDGMRQTAALLAKYDIAYTGIGENLDDAAKPYRVELDDLKIGVYACADYEFSIATDTRAGVNPFDPLCSLDHIAELKETCDYVIVLYHRGKGGYRYPSPALQKTCRKMVEKGADFVFCQHSHCIGCEEKFMHGHIVYGQGNFLFDYLAKEYWNTGLLIEIMLSKEKYDIRYLPVVRCGHAVRLADEAQCTSIMDSFHSRSLEIRDEAFVARNFEAFAESAAPGYMKCFLGAIGKSKTFRIADKILNGRLTHRIFKETNILQLLNCIECETHREVVIGALKGKIGKE